MAPSPLPAIRRSARALHASSAGRQALENCAGALSQCLSRQLSGTPDPATSDGRPHHHRPEAPAEALLGLPRQLQEIQRAGLFKREQTITSPQGPIVSLQEEGQGAGSPATDDQRPGRQVLNFCANNYLGLSNHPRVVEAAQAALASHGFGMSSVRFICGTQDLHRRLERRLAEFHSTEDAVLFPSCFDANAGLFEALLGPEDAVLSDELNHASIIDGIRLCKARRLRFRHSDMDDLEVKLQETRDSRARLIATDGVFSMQGDLARLPEICQLAEKYSALVFVDDCHATGFIGPGGRGTPNLFGIQDKVHIVSSTLGKALGGATGGYTVASAEIATMLRQRARPYLFSNSLAPSMAAAGIAALDLVSQSSALREQLASNTQRFRSRMAELGFSMLPRRQAGPPHPIVPVMLGDARLAHDMAERLLALGIYVVGFSYPVVPKGEARIRVQLSASHSPEQVDMCIDAFAQVGRELRII